MMCLSRPARFIATLVLLQFAFVVFYLAAEDCVHFWDYAMYANMALNWFSIEGHLASLAAFMQSLSSKYNLLYAVPSQIGFSLFGPSRTTFILTNFAVFFLAHEIAIGFVLKRVFGLEWTRALLCSLVLCPLVPFMWYPLLQGYPDNSAAACLVFALGLLLREKRSWRETLGAGALMGLSIVLRRHYAYPVLAVLFAAGYLDFLSSLRAQTGSVVKRVQRVIVCYGALGLVLVGVLLCLEPAYIKEILTTNYSVLYKSYERTPVYFTLFFLSRMGITLLLGVVAGFINAYDPSKSQARPLKLVLLTTIVWLLLWAFGPAQAGDHYLISLAPVCCVVGLYGLLTTRTLGKATRPALIIATIALTANMVQALWFSPFVLPSEKPVVAFDSSPRPPWARDDMNELNFLAATMIHKTTESDRIAIGGSSFVFNQDLMRSILVDRAHRPDVAARFIPTPESDGEQDPPLDAYASANIFLIASPPQYHLAAEGQKVVTGLVERFPPPPELADYYEKDKQAFRLMNDVIVTVWRRKADLPPALLHKELASIRALKPLAREWVTGKTQGVIQPGRNERNDNVFLFHHPIGKAYSSLFYDAQLKQGSYRVKLNLQTGSACHDLSFTTILSSGDGKTKTSHTSAVFVTDGPAYIPFSVEGHDNDVSFLELGLNTHGRSGCTVALWQLQLEQMSP